jgi:hypothetical protein
MAYTLAWELHGVTKVFTGRLTYDDLMHSSEIVEGHHKFDDLRFVIYDLLAIDSVEFPIEDVEELAAVDAAAAVYNRKIRAAIVSTNEQVIAAANAYMASPFNAYKFKIFSTVAAARLWLGLPSAHS